MQHEIYSGIVNVSGAIFFVRNAHNQPSRGFYVVSFTGGQGQKSQMGVRFPFLRGGVNFSNQREVIPPSAQKNVSPATLIAFHSTFYMKYQSVNDIVSPPQAKIFINCAMKGKNQAFEMILHITIYKNLPRDKNTEFRVGTEFSHQRPEGGSPLLHLW